MLRDQMSKMEFQNYSEVKNRYVFQYIIHVLFLSSADVVPTVKLMCFQFNNLKVKSFKRELTTV